MEQNLKQFMKTTNFIHEILHKHANLDHLQDESTLRVKFSKNASIKNNSSFSSFYSSSYPSSYQNTKPSFTFFINPFNRRIHLCVPTSRVTFSRNVSHLIIPTVSKFIKTSGLVAISPQLRIAIKNRTIEGEKFIQHFVFNACRTIHSLYGGNPIHSPYDVGLRIYNSPKHYNRNSEELSTNFALHQHLVSSMLAGKEFDTSIISTIAPKIDYTSFKKGVSSLQFLEAGTFHLTIDHLVQNPNTNIIAINSNCPPTPYNKDHCYQIMKQPYSDFKFQIQIDRPYISTIQRFFDVKISLRSPEEALPYTTGYLAIASQLDFNKYNKKYPGQIGSVSSQNAILKKDTNQSDLVKKWQEELKNINAKTKNPQNCFQLIRDVNDEIVKNPEITALIPCYFNQSPLDYEFSLLDNDPQLLMNVLNFTNSGKIDIDRLISTQQVVDVQSIEDYILNIAQLFKPDIAQQIIYNFWKVKTLPFI